MHYHLSWRFFVAVALFVCATTQPLVAQFYNFDRFSVDEGLSQSQARSIYQDPSGYMWVATYGGGLNRFDGREFITYNESSGLADNTIWRLSGDSAGNVWAATSQGLTKYDGKTFTTFTEENGLPVSDVWAVTVARDGRVWAGTSGQGLAVYDGDSFKTIDPGNEVLNGGINYIFEDRDGAIWVGTEHSGLAKYSNGKFTYFSLLNGLTDNQVNHITQHPDGAIYVSTGTGVSIIEDEQVRPLLKGEIAVRNIFAVLFDRAGNTWYGTEQNGLYCTDGERWRHYEEDNGLSSDYVFDLLEDQNGNVWVATDGGGLSKFSGNMFIHHTRQSGLVGGAVMDIHEDKDGRMWFATDRGLSIFHAGQYEQWTSEKGLSNSSLHEIFEDSRGHIWLATRVGVTRMRPEQQPEAFTRATGFMSGEVYHIFEDRDSVLWMCTERGVYHFKDEQFFRWEEDSLLASEVVYVIFEDEAGDLWFGTNDGLTRFDGHNYHSWIEGDGLRARDVSDIWEAPNGDLWLLTGRGISVYRDNHFYQVNLSDGLSSNNIYSMIYYENCLWLGNEKGLDRVWLDDKYEVDKVKFYGRHEGFRGVETNGNSVLIDSKGYLWIGTIKGATRYDPSEDRMNDVAPQLLFNGLRLFYEDVDWVARCQNVDDYRVMPEGACLAYSDNHLTFDFIGINFRSPKNVSYQFMLQGFDAEWQPETDLNKATYSNIPPGEYVFRVRAGNEDNVWSNPIEFPFMIETPFWRSTWFYLVVGPATLILLYLIILVRTRSLERSKRRLEETVRQRTKEISAQKDKVEKLSVVASETADGVVLCDGNGDLVWINEGLYRMVGYTLEEIREIFGGNLRELSSFPHIEDVLEGRWEERFAQYDTDFPKKNGDIIWTSTTITPIFSEEGKLVRVIATYRDVTARKTAERDLIVRDKELIDSINYAKQIQEAILPSKAKLYKSFPESFIFYRPRDIVSGDFYWFSKVGKVFIAVAADCTGHGVPGAFMSMIGNEFLHQIVNNSSITGPEQALKTLDQKIKRALHQEGSDRESRDGMDIAMCAIHLESKFCQFAGAFNPMYIVRDGALIELDAAKESIGGYTTHDKLFYSHEIALQKDDVVYLFSDGFIDQFGGPRGKKYMRKRFKELLLEISPEDMTTQQIRLGREFDAWRGDEKQVDDVLVLGLRIT